MLKKLAGMFVELPEETQAAQQPAKTLAPLPGAAPVRPTIHNVISMPNVDPQMLEVLQKRIVSRPTAYTALLDHADAFSDVIPDENMRLQAAGKAVTKDGSRTTASILQAIDVHIADVEGERMRFKQTTDNQIQMKSGKLREQVVNLEKQNQNNASEIERLQAQIAKLQENSANNATAINDLTIQANQAESDIVATAESFERAVEYVKNDLTNKKSKLASVLS